MAFQRKKGTALIVLMNVLLNIVQKSMKECFLAS
jgi:hypothetical protein